MIEPEIRAEFAKVEGLVEANSFERLSLWKEEHERETWTDIGMGYHLTIGELDDRPVCVTFTFADIRGRRICFYDAVSQLVDHKMVDEFLSRTFPGVPKTDAMNFPNVFRC